MLLLGLFIIIISCSMSLKFEDFTYPFDDLIGFVLPSYALTLIMLRGAISPFSHQFVKLG
jgi:hypothetical protein